MVVQHTTKSADEVSWKKPCGFKSHRQPKGCELMKSHVPISEYERLLAYLVEHAEEVYGLNIDDDNSAVRFANFVRDRNGLTRRIKKAHKTELAAASAYADLKSTFGEKFRLMPAEVQVPDGMQVVQTVDDIIPHIKACIAEEGFASPGQEPEVSWCVAISYIARKIHKEKAIMWKEQNAKELKVLVYQAFKKMAKNLDYATTTKFGKNGGLTIKRTSKNGFAATGR